MRQNLKINSPNVIFENIDDEVVVIDLNSGSYYSLIDAAADIWEMISDSMSSKSIVSALACKYDAKDTEIQAAYDSFIQKIILEGLVIEGSNISIDLSQKESANGNSMTPQKIPFTNPKLNKYDDMKELLYLDPIHDVNESGWPNAI